MRGIWRRFLPNDVRVTIIVVAWYMEAVVAWYSEVFPSYQREILFVLAVVALREVSLSRGVLPRCFDVFCFV